MWVAIAIDVRRSCFMLSIIFITYILIIFSCVDILNFFIFQHKKEPRHHRDVSSRVWKRRYPISSVARTEHIQYETG